MEWGFFFYMTIIELLSSVIISIVPLGWQLGTTIDYCGWDTAGIYQGWRIYVCESWLNTEFYVQHEIGHHLYSKLTQEQKDQYTKQYNIDRKRGLRAFWREYGYSDVEEDFADNYASWQTKERVNTIIRKRIKIILSFLTL